MNHATKTPDLSVVQDAMVQAAILAPSPDNNQPWKFRQTEIGLDVFLDPDHSLPSDEASMFDLTAIGAAVENAVLAASEYEFKSEVVCHDLEEETLTGRSPIASIRICSGGRPDPLFDSIERRCTCRKPYSSEPLEQNLLDELSRSIDCFAQVRVDWITMPAEKTRFGKLIAATDSLRFRTEAFHAELFRQLRFKQSEVEATRDGLDVRTLELPFGVTSLLGMLKHWSLMRVVHSLRLTPLMTAPSKIAVQRSGAVAVISVPRAGTEEFLTGGRAIQRLWLASAQAELSMHPLGSLPIFLLQPSPSPAFQKTISAARKETSALLPHLGERVIQLAFRIGTSGPPTQRSLRRNVSEVLVSR
jgi:hypothetical protein